MDNPDNLKAGTRGTFLVDRNGDAALRLFSIHHVLNIMAERATADDDDGAHTLWLLAKLVEEVGELFHGARTATVVRDEYHAQVDVDVTGKAAPPEGPKDLNRFMLACLPGGKDAHHG